MIAAVVAAVLPPSSWARMPILGERLSGTAAWVLSKPLRRPAFILAKLIAHGLGLLATWVVLPGAVAYLEFAVLGKVHLPIPGFAAALGLAYLNLIFYLTLVLMLATLFQGRGPVLGIADLRAVGLDRSSPPGCRAGGCHALEAADGSRPNRSQSLPDTWRRASRCPRRRRSSPPRCGACCSPAWPSGAWAGRNSRRTRNEDV